MPSLIPAVSRTMAVFEAFAREKRELSNKEMSRLLSLADSSCLDLLHTLHSLGYLLRTPRTLRFYPSGRWHEIARLVGENDPLRAVAQEVVDQLAEKTNETAFFGVLDQSVAKVVATQSSRLPLRVIVEIGEHITLHGSALGRALLGLLPSAELAAEAERLVRQQPLGRPAMHAQALMQHIAQGRLTGCYEVHNEGAEHVSALAVSGWLTGAPVAISLAGPAERISRNRETLMQALCEVRSALLVDSEST